LRKERAADDNTCLCKQKTEVWIEPQQSQLLYAAEGVARQRCIRTFRHKVSNSDINHPPSTWGLVLYICWDIHPSARPQRKSRVNISIERLICAAISHEVSCITQVLSRLVAGPAQGPLCCLEAVCETRRGTHQSLASQN
jgi:hypothetical protein